MHETFLLLDVDQGARRRAGDEPIRALRERGRLGYVKVEVL